MRSRQVSSSVALPVFWDASVVWWWGIGYHAWHRCFCREPAAGSDVWWFGILQVGEKQDPDGQRWLTADAILSALGAGDYVVEVTVLNGGAEQRVLTPIRVTR